jgi:aspartate kinase
MSVKVVKFGGSSIADVSCIRQAAQIVSEQSKKTKVIVVLSAQKGMTDYLYGKALEVSSMPDKREMDVLLSAGEVISIALFTMHLKERKVKVKSLTASQAGIFTNREYTKAKIKSIDIIRIESELKQNDVLIIAGFQGVTAKNDITTLGRGGSDITAVAIAKALCAKEVDIYSDVDGIYSMDPNMNANAILISSVSYEEMLELSGSGAKVLNNRCVEIAAKERITINLYSTFTKLKGTSITKEKHMIEGVKVTSITKKDNLVVCRYELDDSQTSIEKVLGELSKARISIDLFTYDAKTLHIVFEKDERTQIKEINARLGVREKSIKLFNNLSRVSVIGYGLKKQPGIAFQVVSIIKNNNVDIELVSCSETNISCFIKRDKADELINSLHEELIEKQED